MIWLLYAWLCWVALNFGAMLLASFVLRPDAPCFTGLVTVMPAWLDGLLAPEERHAILLHERAHKFYGDVWFNFARRCFFLPVSKERIAEQERAADAYVTMRGYHSALWSARLKIRERRKV
jgi:hypothetical protein